MTRQGALDFVASNHRAVLVTRRSDGGVQVSPITAGVDDDGYVVISSRETAYKVRNLRKDPRATLCVMTDAFYGEWISIEGEAEFVTLPEAMEGLVDYYRRISGEHPDWDEYRRVMEEDRRLLIRIPPTKVGPTKSG
jgi:PPOX class probable F420-dependent enzyme